MNKLLTSLLFACLTLVPVSSQAATRDAEIMYPAQEDVVVTGTITLAVALHDVDNDNTAYWAVWSGNCSNKGTVVAGTDLGSPSEWNGTQLSAKLNTLAQTAGAYCFFFSSPGKENEQEAKAYRNFKISGVIDKTAPKVKIVAPLDGATITNGVVDVIGSIDEDNLAECFVSITDSDGHVQAEDTCIYLNNFKDFENKLLLSESTKSYDEGVYAVNFNAKDTSGNVGNMSVKFKVKHPILPTIPVMLGFKNPTFPCEGGVTNADKITLDWSDSKDVDGIAGYNVIFRWYPLNRGKEVDWELFTTKTETTTALENDGEYLFLVRAKDNVGDYSEWSALCDIRRDQAAPEVVISSPKDDGKVSGKVEVVGSISDITPESYEVRISDAKNKLIATSGKIKQGENLDKKTLWKWDTSKVADGTYTVRVQAWDKAGNLGSNSVVVLLRNGITTRPWRALE